MINIASCEDNKNIRDVLYTFFKRIEKEERLDIEVNFFTSAEDLLNVSNKKYDIFILDIELGENHINGMNLAYEIRKRDEKAIILFLTSKREYVTEGYKVRAFRFLTKPTTYKEFKQDVVEAIHNVNLYMKNRFMMFENNQKFYRVLIDDIIFVETKGRKTVLYLKNKSQIETSYSISDLATKLKNENFYRCYNSYLVNLRYVDDLHGSTVRIWGRDLPVSKIKVKEFRKILDSQVRKSIIVDYKEEF